MRTAALGAMLGSVALGACGSDDGPRLSRRAFVTRADAACRRLLAASDTLRTTGGQAARGEELTARVHEAAEGLRDFARRLDALVPPEALAEAVAGLVADVERYADLLDRLGERARPDEDYLGLQESNPELIGRLNELATRTTDAIGRVGLLGCLPRAP